MRHKVPSTSPCTSGKSIKHSLDSFGSHLIHLSVLSPSPSPKPDGWPQGGIMEEGVGRLLRQSLQSYRCSDASWPCRGPVEGGLPHAQLHTPVYDMQQPRSPTSHSLRSSGWRRRLLASTPVCLIRLCHFALGHDRATDPIFVSDGNFPRRMRRGMRAR